MYYVIANVEIRAITLKAQNSVSDCSNSHHSWLCWKHSVYDIRYNEHRTTKVFLIQKHKVYTQQQSPAGS